MPTYYQISFQGHLDGRWSEWFDGLTITNAADGQAILAGVIEDQAALFRVLLKLRDLGLPLIAVHPSTQQETSNVQYEGTTVRHDGHVYVPEPTSGH